MTFLKKEYEVYMADPVHPYQDIWNGGRLR